MAGVFPDSGVPASQALNALPNPPVTDGCTPLYNSSSRCNPRFDPAAANAVVSEIMNVMICAGIDYDCNKLDNLCTAIRALADVVPAGLSLVTGNSQGIILSTETQVTNFQIINNEMADSVITQDSVTIGALDAGWYNIAVKLMYDFPGAGNTMDTNVILYRNNLEITGGNAHGTTAIRARPQASCNLRLNAGDVITVKTTSDTTRNLVNGGSVWSFSKFGG